MVSWYRCASWVTTPTTSRSESRVTSRISAPPILTTPLVGSYIRDTRWVIVVFAQAAPDGPMSAVSFAAGATKLTSVSACWPEAKLRSGTGSAIDSSEASETSDAAG